MKPTLENRMKRIHRTIEEGQQPIVEPRFKLSLRNTPLDEELRTMLLRIHEDGEISRIVAADTHNVLGHFVVLYDPNPEDDKNRYLGWGVHSGQVRYAVLRDGGLSCFGEQIPFQKYEGRFYAEREELLEHFPELTPNRLEDCTQKALSRYLQEKRKTVYR